MTPTLPDAVILGAGLVHLALAALVMALRAPNPAARALALWLVAQGMIFVAGRFARFDPAGAAFWPRLYPYFILSSAVFALAFAATYPRPRGFLARFPWPVAPFLVAAAVLWLLYALRHDLWTTPDGAEGPLRALGLGLLYFAGGVWVLVFAHRAVGYPAGPQRASLLLVSAAYGLVMAHDLVATAIQPVAGFRWLGSDLAVMGTSAVFLFGASAVAMRAFARGDAALRGDLRRYLAAMGVAALSGLVLAGGSGDAFTYTRAVWRLALPLAVTFAVLRHHLLDIDLKVKWTVKQSTIAAAFVGVFFVVSEGASAFFAETAGSEYYGIAVAGLLVFAMAPLQRAAERVAEAAMPGVKRPEEMTADERRETYRDMLRLAWRDDHVDRSERAMLQGLRERLGLSAEDAERLEREVLAGAPA